MSKLPRAPNDFYGRPRQFSFKDLLAILFTAGFFYVCYRAITEPQALELVKSIAYLIAIILGGYFGQEMVTVWADKYQTQSDAAHHKEVSNADYESKV